MHAQRPWLRGPLLCASLWCLALACAVLAAGVVMATEPQWHAMARRLQQISSVQTWISIAACLGLMLLSKRKYAETVEAWGQTTLIYIVGGLLTALLFQYGLMPQWLAHPDSLRQQLLLLVIGALHLVCAVATLRSLLRFRRGLPQTD